MADNPTPPLHQSYLLRVWRESPNGAWRASLENVITGQRHYFTRLTDLVVFLENPVATSD
jgi:hypothetical protein